ncbi:hypothetical protein BDZ94DRAFT_1327731 [Collybia nuda]|uniref:Uncharacterized protein n=1 Tax=Collybia nuda TaxID=64659 RepID=A0A9P6CQX7_9AGAR|nr:hypothetical protein BDZ94DRAFT_1327731 [Collybia nuda]
MVPGSYESITPAMRTIVGKTLLDMLVQNTIFTVFYGFFLLLFTHSTATFIRGGLSRRAQKLMLLASTATFIIATIREGTLIIQSGIFIRSIFFGPQDPSRMSQMPLDNGLDRAYNLVLMWTDMFETKDDDFTDILNVMLNRRDMAMGLLERQRRTQGEKILIILLESELFTSVFYGFSAIYPTLVIVLVDNRRTLDQSHHIHTSLPPITSMMTTAPSQAIQATSGTSSSTSITVSLEQAGKCINTQEGEKYSRLPPQLHVAESSLGIRYTDQFQTTQICK